MIHNCSVKFRPPQSGSGSVSYCCRRTRTGVFFPVNSSRHAGQPRHPPSNIGVCTLLPFAHPRGGASHIISGHRTAGGTTGVFATHLKDGQQGAAPWRPVGVTIGSDPFAHCKGKEGREGGVGVSDDTVQWRCLLSLVRSSLSSVFSVFSVFSVLSVLSVLFVLFVLFLLLLLSLLSRFSCFSCFSLITCPFSSRTCSIGMAHLDGSVKQTGTVLGFFVFRFTHVGQPLHPVFVSTTDRTADPIAQPIGIMAGHLMGKAGGGGEKGGGGGGRKGV